MTGAWREPITLTVVNNHWKSKAGDETVNAVRRTDQARHVATLVQAKLDADPNALVAVLGLPDPQHCSADIEDVTPGCCAGGDASMAEQAEQDAMNRGEAVAPEKDRRLAVVSGREPPSAGSGRH